MAYALVESRSPVTAGAGSYVTSLNDSFTTAPAVGSLVIVSFGGDHSTVTYTVSDNKGNTYTKLELGAGADSFGCGIAYCVVGTSGGTFTVTVAQVGQESNTMQIANFSGNETSSVLDQSNSSGFALGTTVSTSSATAMAGELIISLFRSGDNSVSSTGVPSGYTAMLGANAANGNMTNLCVISAYKVAGAIATETAAWPGVGAYSSEQSLIAAFKPAAGGGPTVTTVSSNSATEGSSIVHTVTLSAAVTGSAASYAITLAGGTATGGGTDYTSTLSNGMFSDSVTVSGGNISVPVGVSTFTVTVSTAGDTIDEANETYTLTIGGTAGTGTINDDDAAPVITVGDAPSVTAGSPAVFTISLDRAKSTSITVDAACVDGTLVGGVGYTSNLASATISNGVTFGAGALTIPAGVTSFTVSIPTT